MPFNEKNSVENLIIQVLTGVNLNLKKPNHSKSLKARSSDSIQKYSWQYTPPEYLNRDTSTIFIEPELKRALLKLNPSIQNKPELADDIINKLNGILTTVKNVGLVRANEEFSKWLKAEISMPIGEDHSYVPIKLFDFDTLENNTFWITNQFSVKGDSLKIPDLVFFINGIPVIVGEVKTSVRPAITWLDGAFDIYNTYEEDVPKLFVPNVFSFVTEGKELYIAGVRTPTEYWSPWRLEESNEEPSIETMIGLKDVSKQIRELLNPRTVLDIVM